MNFLRKLFDTSKKDIDLLLPIVSQINAFETEISALDDDALRAKGPYFKAEFEAGKTLDQLLPEVFAVVREVSTRTLGMRHFDVQHVGSMVLHQGRISEMKTGEGKTLVAVAPLILNALTGRGAHLVTANDYLARRDAVWMGPIFHFLGISLGIIQGQGEDTEELGGSYLYVPGADQLGDPRYMNLVPCSRREAYLCDVVYGTNHEFGFDYLRDNMAFDISQLSMRELHYAIVDEVDSILIDEARTPHIISGASNEDVSLYKHINEIAKKLEDETHYKSDKKNHSVSLTEDGMDFVEEMMEIDNIASDPKVLHHVNAAVKAIALFDKDVDYVVRGNEVVLVDENTGRLMFGRRLSDGLHQALEAKENVTVQRESQTVAVITFQNLFRLYEKLAGMTGTAKTEEDEFRKIYGLDVVCVPTHRPMIRIDHGDIIFKTLEAKFRAITWDVLRLYSKQQPVLIGTRSIEMSEVMSTRLTTDLLQKLVLSQRLRYHLEVKKDVPKDIVKDVIEITNTPLAEQDRKALANFASKVGLSGEAFSQENMDWALDQWKLTSENKTYLEEGLTHGIPHNILNAKFHEREALIIAEAGRKGAVTIATNMAGRGVDILLGGRIQDEQIVRARDSEGDPLLEQYESTFSSFRRGGKERAAPPLPLSDQERREVAEVVRALDGVYILGTERHESRRIDNQLRGRSGRQGDPGESRFYVSLEDQLWKIFNANMLENPLLKAWPPMEEVNAKFLSRMIEKTQERIENHYFEARKHVLEYDDVLNAQREHIYGMRREVLLGKHVREDLVEFIKQMITDIVNDGWVIDENEGRNYDYTLLYEDLNGLFPLVDFASVDDLQAIPVGEGLIDKCTEFAMAAYSQKAERYGDEIMATLEQQVMLRAVNDKWMEHLQMVEYIREGIGLRGYGQTDPLVAYKRETFDLFQTTLKQIRDQAVRMIFSAEIQVQDAHQSEEMNGDAPAMVRMEDGDSAPAMSAMASSAPFDESRQDWSKVGRNDPCPCGSGKKFKACHYPKLREKGII
jgi:preprotein translocase subunit SecA